MNTLSPRTANTRFTLTSKGEAFAARVRAAQSFILEPADANEPITDETRFMITDKGREALREREGRQ